MYLIGFTAILTGMMVLCMATTSGPNAPAKCAKYNQLYPIHFG
jgi:hypothetical protein